MSVDVSHLSFELEGRITIDELPPKPAKRSSLILDRDVDAVALMIDYAAFANGVGLRLSVSDAADPESGRSFSTTITVDLLWPDVQRLSEYLDLIWGCSGDLGERMREALGPAEEVVKRLEGNGEADV